MTEQRYKSGNEFLPYHPAASHVEPGYRDGWNACWQAAIASREPQWPPIDSALKDGTKFLAVYGRDDVFTMRWLDIPGDAGLFVYVDELMSDVDPAPDMPSHWMPLPPPPKD